MKHPLLETQHQNRVLDVQDKLFLDKERKVNEMLSYIRAMSLKDDNCMKILENAAAQMSIEKYKKE